VYEATVNTTILNFEDLLAIKNLGDLRAAVSRHSRSLSLPQVQQLLLHVESIGCPAHCLRLGLVRHYSTEMLDPWLSLAAQLQGLKLEIYHAPYGLIVQEAQVDSGLARHEPDLTVLMLRREDLHPDLIKPVVGLDSNRQERLRREIVERLSETLVRFREHRLGYIVLTILPPLFSPAQGIYDAQCPDSETAWWTGVKTEIGRRLREPIPATLFLDLDDVLQQIGRSHFFDRRFWYSSRFPFSAEGSAEIARRLIALGALIKLPKAKVIVLDADNTLWGGVLGEDGINGIALGPDYPGNAFLDFQRRLLGYQQRGFILALCSKNNPADIEQVFKYHPHQILREEHFAARRVNWLPKAENLFSLAAELNLGLESFVLVDDSDHECASVRQALPEVEVVQTPSKPADVPICLEQVARLEVLSVTAEDRAKTELYVQEHRRRELKQSSEKTGVALRDYLVSLNMKMRLGFNDSSHLTRLSQLTQKTNQFNLTTRRYNEGQMLEFIVSREWMVVHCSVVDVFGDTGIVGLAIVHVTSRQQAELDSFLMSCRALGREIESALLEATLRHLAEQGVREVIAFFEPTKKNQLAEKFLPGQGFAQCSDGQYRRDLRKAPPLPESAFPIAVEQAGSIL
jgi:FkbH-like protein